MPGDRAERVGGAILFFLLGFSSLTLQTILIREALFAFHGGEIALGLFFAVWLGGIGAGARWGASVAARAPSDSEPPVLRSWALGLASLLWAGWLQIALFRVHRHLFSVEAGGYLPALAYLLLLLPAALPAAVLTGYLFPMGLRARRITPGSGYAWESFGSMAGGAWASLFALTRLPALTLVCALAPLLLAGLIAVRALGRRAESDGRLAARAAVAWRRAELRAPMVLLLLLAAAGLTSAGDALDALLLRLRWSGLDTGTRAVSMHDTPYHQVTLAERDGELSLYIDGLYQGGVADPYVDSLSAAIVATQHPDPQRMLVLAPACHGTVAVLAASAGERLVLVREDADLDRILEVTREPETGGREIVTTTADPRAAVRGMSPSFDLIALLRGTAAGAAANRFYTQEFFAACAARLSPGGVLALSLPGAANVASPEARVSRAAVTAALLEVFAEVRISPGTTHYLFAATPRGRPAQSQVSARALSWDPDTLAARRARLWPRGRAWPAGVFAQLYPPQRVAALQATIDRDRAAGVAPNRDGRPLVFYEQLRRWDRLSGSGLGWLLAGWHERPWRISLWAIAGFALFGFWIRRRAGQAVVSLATTGLVGIGADLLLLLLYQTLRGTLYLNVGLIVALYMLGLGGGGWAGTVLAPRNERRATALLDVGWVAFLLVAVPLLGPLRNLEGAALEVLLFALVLLAGGLTGLPFAWVARSLQRGGAPRGVAVAGGLADAADHLGAVGGALLTGIFLIPLLGFSGTLLFLAALKLLSAIGWWVPGGGGAAWRAGPARAIGSAAT